MTKSVTASEPDAHASRPRSEADSLVLTLARIIVAIERRRRPVVIEGGKSVAEKSTR